VFAAADEGDRVGRIAERLRVSVSYVSKVLRRERQPSLTLIKLVVVSVKLCKKGFGDVSLFGRTRPFLCPDLVMHWASGAGAVKDGRRPPPEAARSVLDGGERGATLVKAGGRFMPPLASAVSCIHAGRPCSSSAGFLASPHVFPLRAPEPVADSSRGWGRSGPHACDA